MAVYVELRDPLGRTRTLRDVDGRPVVAAFAPRLPFGPDDEETVRAELRGLGAALIAVTPDAIWLVQPDDPIVALEPVLYAHAPDRLFALYGAKRGRSTLVVLDDDGSIRWRHETPDLLGELARAAAIRDGAGLLVTRREILVSALVGALALAVLPGTARGREPAAASAPTPGGDLARVTLRVNGEDRMIEIEPRVTLLDALREVIGLTGTKKGCDHGQCGACTVLVEGRRVLSCLTLAIMHEGEKLTTIEGLAEGDKLHPMQAAFLEKDAFQCGYCTPGQILSAVALVAEGHARTADEIREGMSGNICRCGAYPNIVAAIEHARRG